MPRASAADAALTAERILDAAATLFADPGFADVSLDDVARRANVTRGAVYHHFKNKVGLFAAVAARQQRAVAALVIAAARPHASSAEQLRAGSHAFLDAITEPARARILLVDAPAVIGWQTWRAMDAENSVVALREVLRDIGVAGDLLDAMTAQLSGAMNEAALWIVQEGGGHDVRRRGHAALDVVLGAVV